MGGRDVFVIVGVWDGDSEGSCELGLGTKLGRAVLGKHEGLVLEGAFEGIEEVVGSKDGKKCRSWR